MTIKLKLCPFCGGEAKLNYSRPYFVKCSKCFAKSGVASTPAFATINWNTRKSMDKIIERLEEELPKKGLVIMGGRGNGKTYQAGYNIGVAAAIDIVKECDNNATNN